MAENAVCPKAMLILLLCHLQVYPLCSNAPPQAHIDAIRSFHEVLT